MLFERGASSFGLFVGFYEPEIGIRSAQDLRKDVGCGRIPEFGGKHDGLADHFTVESDGMGHLGHMFVTIGDVQRILGHARRISRSTYGSLCDTAQLDDTFRDEIHIHTSVRVNLVKDSMQGKEVRPFQIPMGLFGLHHEINGVGQAPLEQGGDFSACLFWKAVPSMGEYYFHRLLITFCWQIIYGVYPPPNRECSLRAEISSGEL